LVKGFKDKNGKFHPTEKRDKFGQTFKEFARTGERRNAKEMREAEELRIKKGIKRRRPFVVIPSEKEVQKKEILKMLKDKGFKLTTELSSDPVFDPDDPVGEEEEFTSIEITEKQTLDAINGKRTAKEINDFITGTTENQRLRFNIDAENKLSDLQDQGKIKFENNVWMKV